MEKTITTLDMQRALIEDAKDIAIGSYEEGVDDILDKIRAMGMMALWSCVRLQLT